LYTKVELQFIKGAHLLLKRIITRIQNISHWNSVSKLHQVCNQTPQLLQPQVIKSTE